MPNHPSNCNDSVHTYTSRTRGDRIMRRPRVSISFCRLQRKRLLPLLLLVFYFLAVICRNRLLRKHQRHLSSSSSFFGMPSAVEANAIYLKRIDILLRVCTIAVENSHVEISCYVIMHNKITVQRFRHVFSD